MRSLILRLFVALSLAVAAAPVTASAQDDASAESAADLNVNDLAFALTLEERQPVDRATTFKVGEKIYGWVELANSGAETAIEMVWKRDGSESWRTTLSVGRGKTWRTWARKKFRKGDAGTWTVEIVADDKVLKSATFTVSE